MEPKRPDTQPTQPKGIDPTTGKPYEPAEIPVPKRGEVMDFFRKVMRPGKPDSPGPKPSS
jgi:hypothetical protein